MNRRVKIEMGSCRHLISREHQVLCVGDYWGYFIIYPERCSSQQIIIFPFHKKPLTSKSTDSSMPHLLTVARHLSPIWPQPERLFDKSLEDRQPWNSLLLYWTWQGKPGESFRCDQLPISHLTTHFSEKMSWLFFFLPVQRSHCKHAAGLQAMWLNSRGWRGW